LHKYNAFFTVDLITNQAIISNWVVTCRKELRADIQSKKNQIANLLLIEVFFSLVYNVLKLRYFSTKKVIFNKNAGVTKSNLSFLPL
jgi:hypothetical protein